MEQRIIIVFPSFFDYSTTPTTFISTSSFSPCTDSLSKRVLLITFPHAHISNFNLVFLLPSLAHVDIVDGGFRSTSLLALVRGVAMWRAQPSVSAKQVGVSMLHRTLWLTSECVLYFLTLEVYIFIFLSYVMFKVLFTFVLLRRAQDIVLWV